MKLLNSILKALPEYQALVGALDTPGASAITGLSSIHRAHMLSALQE